jgi:hypothetical protein
MQHRTSEVIRFGSNQVNLSEEGLCSTSDLLTLPTEHILDHNIIDTSKNEERTSFGCSMLPLYDETREQFAKELHVVHYMK